MEGGRRLGVRESRNEHDMNRLKSWLHTLNALLGYEVWLLNMRWMSLCYDKQSVLKTLWPSIHLPSTRSSLCPVISCSIHRQWPLPDPPRPCGTSWAADARAETALVGLKRTLQRSASHAGRRPRSWRPLLVAAVPFNRPDKLSRPRSPETH